jgi:DNA polymerase sigma
MKNQDSNKKFLTNFIEENKQDININNVRYLHDSSTDTKITMSESKLLELMDKINPDTTNKAIRKAINDNTKYIVKKIWPIKFTPDWDDDLGRLDIEIDVRKKTKKELKCQI